MWRRVSLLVMGCFLVGFSGLAQSFSTVVSFGDSLSDTTNRPSTGDYWEGRWSNGPLWDEYFSDFLGATFYDFAASGSQTSDLARQITNATAIAWNDSNTVFTVWSGGNDFIDNATNNGEDPGAWYETITRGVDNIQAGVAALAKAGARFVVVFDLPDLSLMPAVTQDPTLAPEASVIHDLAQSFNEQLQAALDDVGSSHPNLRIAQVDDFSRLDQIVGHPGTYGFTVVTNDAVNVLNDPPLDDPVATNYLFWDVIHPTTKAHALVAKWAETSLAQIPPTLWSGPQSQTVAAKSPVEFSVNAAGATAYQWLFDGRKIRNATNASFSISAATAANAGTYAVIVSNPYGGLESAPALLKVDTAPKFVTNPRSQTGIAGRAVTLSALAGGSAPLGYQWQFDGEDIDGATKRILVLTNLETNEVGSYTLVVTNPVGVVTSKVATLNVIVPPSITSQPEGVAATVGDAVTFSVAAVGTAPLHYQWEFDGVALARQTNDSLTLPSARLGQAGMYRVLVRNLGGAILSSNAVLKVAKSGLVSREAILEPSASLPDPPLLTKVYAVDSYRFYRMLTNRFPDTFVDHSPPPTELEFRTGGPSFEFLAICKAVRQWVSSVGVQLQEPGLQCFFNDRVGRLLIRATSVDHEKVDWALAQDGCGK